MPQQPPDGASPRPRTAALSMLIFIAILPILPSAFAAEVPPLASPAVFQLDGGDQLTARIISESPAAWEVQHAVLGKLTLEKTVAKLIPPAPAPLAEPAPQTAAAAEKPAVDPIKKSLSLGLNGQMAATHRQDWNTRLELKQTHATTRWNADMTWFYSVTDGRKRENEGHALVNHDWFLAGNKNRFVFVRGETYYDELTDWQIRNSAFGGLGYELISDQRGNLQFRGGAGGSYEYGSVDAWRPEAIFASSTSSWKLTESQLLKGELAYYPSLEEFSDYRATLRLEWRSKLPDVKGLSLRVGIHDTLDSMATKQKSNNDFKYFAGIVYDL